jgi:hypothetical protein
MTYQNIQVGYNTETQQPIFEKREVKPRTTKFYRKPYKGSSTFVKYLTLNEV